MQKGEVPNLYDISGSSNFYNKTDYGFTVDRRKNEEGVMSNEVDIYWQKIKFKHLGEQGISNVKYNYNNGRFAPLRKSLSGNILRQQNGHPCKSLIDLGMRRSCNLLAGIGLYKNA